MAQLLRDRARWEEIGPVELLLGVEDCSPYRVDLPKPHPLITCQPPEGVLARDHDVEHDAERPDVDWPALVRRRL